MSNSVAARLICALDDEPPIMLTDDEYEIVVDATDPGHGDAHRRGRGPGDVAPSALAERQGAALAQGALGAIESELALALEAGRDLGRIAALAGLLQRKRPASPLLQMAAARALSAPSMEEVLAIKIPQDDEGEDRLAAVYQLDGLCAHERFTRVGEGDGPVRRALWSLITLVLERAERAPWAWAEVVEHARFVVAHAAPRATDLSAPLWQRLAPLATDEELDALRLRSAASAPASSPEVPALLAPRRARALPAWLRQRDPARQAFATSGVL